MLKDTYRWQYYCGILGAQSSLDPSFYSSQVKSNKPKSTIPFTTDLKGMASKTKW